ncbi:MAG: beta-galactosidase, partial [Kiritimatiellae bacterium]|nr:beta-galactosidase [Kiritimatiellia bacterium]
MEDDMKKAILAAVLAAAGAAACAAHTFEIGESDFLLDGKPFTIRCGEIHYARIPCEYWRHRLKMLRAMGCNAVGCYMFWNYHEREPGCYNWKENADAVAFCRMAQEEGLWVVLRPGPYACAEWEGGGAPWWLLKDDSISMRSSDPKWLEPAKRWIAEVGRVLGPMQVTKGGPILMVQVENEYGLHGNDVEYIKALRQATLDAGFEVPLYACNPPRVIQNGFVPELFQAANFGAEPEQRFAIIREW